jgi:hypothetical protein
VVFLDATALSLALGRHSFRERPRRREGLACIYGQAYNQGFRPETNKEEEERWRELLARIAAKTPRTSAMSKPEKNGGEAEAAAAAIDLSSKTMTTLQTSI